MVEITEWSLNENLVSKLLDENQGQWYHHQRKFFSGGGKMHHNSALLTQQMQPPQKLAKRYWLTFSFSLIVVAKAFLILSTPLFLFLTMTEPRCIQGRNLIAKAYFSQYSQNPLENKTILDFWRITKLTCVGNEQYVSYQISIL